MAPRYLMDTDICIYIRHKQPPKILARFEKMERGDVAISVVTYGELAYGAAKSADTAHDRAGLERLIALIPVLPLPEDAGNLRHYSRGAFQGGRPDRTKRFVDRCACDDRRPYAGHQQ